MCCLLTFFFHLDSFSFFFLIVFFNELQHESYAGVRRHYGSKVLGIYLGPFNKALGPTTDLFWWYGPFIYGRLCPFFFFKGWSFGNFIFVF
jgi:hypothetical protein